MQVVRLPVFKLVKNRLPIVYPSRKSWELIRKYIPSKPSLVVTNTRFFISSILGAWSSKRWGVPHLHIEHGSAHINLGNSLISKLGEVFDHTFGRWVLKRADKIVCVSQSVCEFVFHLSGKDGSVLYNGVDICEDIPCTGWFTSLEIPSSLRFCVQGEGHEAFVQLRRVYPSVGTSRRPSYVHTGSGGHGETGDCDSTSLVFPSSSYSKKQGGQIDITMCIFNKNKVLRKF